MRENRPVTHKHVSSTYPTSNCDDVMNYHRYNIAPLNAFLMGASATFRPQSNKNSDVVRIAWLRQFVATPTHVTALLEKFSDVGIDVWLVNGEHLPLEQILCFDLILLESSNQPSHVVSKSIERIRLGSKAPLILLTDDFSIQWNINALQSGADAILPLNTSTDVILARCSSLLRRWLSNV